MKVQRGILWVDSRGEISLERLEIFENLGVALALGLLIGLERGWKRRDEEEGSRFAGIRTFAIICILGGVMAILGRVADVWVLAVSVPAFVLLIIGGMLRPAMKNGDRDFTSYAAMLLTLLVGVLAGYGYLASAAATAVVVTVLLGLKAPLHAWVRQIERDEIIAFFKLLLISVVVLPLLPDQGYGPWGALNPYEIWWMVVLISAISFAGFVAIKWAGARRGILLTALFGGLASSTAIAVSFARFGKESPALQRYLAAGMAAASTMMFPRMLVVVSVVSPPLGLVLAPIVGIILVGGGVGVTLLWPRAKAAAVDAPELATSFNLGVPIRFGLLLAAVMVIANGATEWLGDAGLYMVSAFAGITDVDAITLSVAGNIKTGLAVKAAYTAVLIAALANTLVKWGIVLVAGGVAMARLVAVPLGLMILGGVAGYLLL